MNEITRIHLGRQPYTISIDANHQLKQYLAAIQRQVGDKDVVNEVELRMAELLSERGISGEKVIIPEDVQYLKAQLGEPEDFDDESVTAADTTAPNPTSRRLFRDRDNALIAGVAAGVAGYFGLDIILVRIAFVLLTIFSGGSGVIVYLLLWLVVPPAESASEKLQMHGKPVTLEALKDSVGQSGVADTAARLNNRLLAAIDWLFRAGVKVLGVAFLATGVGIIATVALIKMYMLLHGDKLFQENLFPVGGREHLLVVLVMALAIISAVFLMLTGVATFKHKWPVRGWVTAVLAGLFLLGSISAGALAGDAAPHVRARYEATLHTTAIKNIQPFNNVVTTGPLDLSYISSPGYAVNLHYSGNPDLSKIKVEVRNGTLYIDSQALDNGNHCTMLCLFPRYNLTAQIYAPNIQDFKTPPRTDIFYPNTPPIPAKP